MIQFFDVRAMDAKCQPAMHDRFDMVKYKGRSFGTVFPREAEHEEFLATVSQSWYGDYPDAYNETEIENMVHLSLLTQIHRPDMVFVELGAGYGGQSLAVHGAVNHSLVPTDVRHVKYIGVEPEPIHYRYLLETYRVNEMDAIPVFGGISDFTRFKPFWMGTDASKSYGQSFHPQGHNLVPCYSMTYITDMFQLPHIDVLDMDIQGEEVEVVQSLPVNSEIDYIKVATHSPDIDTTVRSTLERSYDLIFSVPFGSNEIFIEQLGCKAVFPNDGILLFKRKGIV